MIDDSIVQVIVHAPAPPADVFAYFTRAELLVTWMGHSARLDLVYGGEYYVHMRDGFAAAGTFQVIDPPSRVDHRWRSAGDGLPALTHTARPRRPVTRPAPRRAGRER